MVALDFWETRFYMNDLDKLFKSNTMNANRLSFNLRKPDKNRVNDVSSMSIYSWVTRKMLQLELPSVPCAERDPQLV